MTTSKGKERENEKSQINIRAPNSVFFGKIEFINDANLKQEVTPRSGVKSREELGSSNLN